MDKKAKQIVGLPVVSFSTGNKLYEVEDLVVDPERMQVLALVVEEQSMFHSAKAIPFGRIQAIGPDAVIVPEGKAVMEVNRDALLRRLYNDQVVRGLRVLTDDGRKLGEVTDMVIDGVTGEIKGFDVSLSRGLTAGQELRWLPTERVLSMGKKVMFVPAQTAADFESQTDGISVALDQIGDQVRADEPGRAGAIALGRTAQSTVRAADDTVIVKEGDVVTQDQVDAARDAGRLSILLAAVGVRPESEQTGNLSRQAQQSFRDIGVEARQIWGQLTGQYSQTVDQADDRIMQQRIKNALGRPVTRVIFDSEDNVILNTGDIITNRAVEAALSAGVLDILVASVYTEPPKLTTEELKAPHNGTAGLDAAPDADLSAVEPVAAVAATDTAPAEETPQPAAKRRRR